MTPKVRIVVVDDHALFRRGLVSLLSDMEEFEMAGEAGSGEEALRVVPAVAPDMVLLDINMPGMSGIQVLEALRRSGQNVRVLMLTISQYEEDLVGAIVAGADGYLLKNAEPELLRSTIRQVMAGKSVLSSEMTAQVFGLLRRATPENDQGLLSDRELEVLRCLARGLTTSQVAADLYISENTVKTHIRHIMEKMEVNNRAEAVAKALQAKMI
jgi:DNA-binding NarL/FixJ family response regulator